MKKYNTKRQKDTQEKRKTKQESPRVYDTYCKTGSI